MKMEKHYNRKEAADDLHKHSSELDGQNVCDIPSQQFCGIEPFVDTDRVAEFLSMPRTQVLRLTRGGTIRAYPVSGSLRHVWKYRLSELAEDIAARQKPARSTIVLGDPRGSEAKEKVNG